MINLKLKSNWKLKSKPKIVNIVATGQFLVNLNIDDLVKNLRVESLEYDPETYCGLLAKIKFKSKLGERIGHVTLYSNGKYIITGIDSKENLNYIYEELIKKLKEAKALP